MLDYYRFREIYDLYAKGQIEEARQHLSELQARYVALCDENSMLRAQVQGYEDILYLSRNLVFDGSFFWLITGSIKQGPFCPVCYNRDGLLLRLTDDGTCRHCLTCGSRFTRSNTPPEKQLSRQTVSGMAQGSPAIQNDTPNEDDIRPTHSHKATILPFTRQAILP